MAAISSALLDVPITGAQGIVFNVLGGRDMSLQVTDMFMYLKL
jgi:cell division GTPase FtsZ